MTHGYEFFEYDYSDLDVMDIIGFGDVEPEAGTYENIEGEWGEIDYDDIVGWF